MRDQDPTLDALFEARRSVERRPNTERDRLRGAVAGRLAAAGVISGSATVAVKALAGGLEVAGSSTLFVLTKAKLAMVLAALACAGTVGTLLFTSSPTKELQNADGVRALSSAARIAPIAIAASTEPVAAPPIPSIANDIVTHQSTPGRTASTRLEHGSLAEELAAVRSAQGALAGGEATRALKLLDSYFRQFPSGVLLPEAKATQIRALCRAGLAEQANRQAQAFEAAHRDSPLAAGSKLRCNTASK